MSTPSPSPVPSHRDSQWNFSPSLPASILFLTLFALATAAHTVQAIYHRKLYCLVIICSAVAQTLTYIFRTLSIQNVDNLPDYEAWFILILISPLFTNAFVYMVFGRMVQRYTPAPHRIWKVAARHFTVIFVTLDIVALFVQISGAAMAATASGNSNTVWTGLHIYMSGMGIQQLFILIFSVYALRLGRIVQKDAQGHERRSALWLLGAIFAALLLITLRICFRLDEYSQGIKSTIPNHEAYQYTLDSLPMLAAIVIFNLVHPERIISEKPKDGVAPTGDSDKETDNRDTGNP